MIDSNRRQSSRNISDVSAAGGIPSPIMLKKTSEDVRQHSGWLQQDNIYYLRFTIYIKMWRKLLLVNSFTSENNS